EIMIEIDPRHRILDALGVFARQVSHMSHRGHDHIV
ncbi:unnamed protein product, partial [marine sediment metagenome]